MDGHNCMAELIRRRRTRPAGQSHNRLLERKRFAGGASVSSSSGSIRDRPARAAAPEEAVQASGMHWHRSGWTIMSRTTCLSVWTDCDTNWIGRCHWLTRNRHAVDERCQAVCLWREEHLCCETEWCRAGASCRRFGTACQRLDTCLGSSNERHPDRDSGWRSAEVGRHTSWIYCEVHPGRDADTRPRFAPQPYSTSKVVPREGAVLLTQPWAG